MANSTVQIMEPLSTGHRMVFVKWMSVALADAGAQVSVVTTNTARQHPACQDLERIQNHSISVVESKICAVKSSRVPGPAGLLLGQWRHWHAMRATYRQLETFESQIFVPYLDYFDKLVGVLGSPFGRSPWSGLVMRPSFHYHKMGIEAPVKRVQQIEERMFLKLLQQPTLERVLTIDVRLEDYIRGTRLKDSNKIHWLPDPQSLGVNLDAQHARVHLGLSPAARYLLVYGSITMRKGVDRLCQLAQSGIFPDNWRLLVAGTLHRDALARFKALQSSPGWNQRVTIIDGFVSDQDEEALLRASNAVWAAYEGHYGSSGMLPLAAAAGIPVLSCRQGLIGDDTRTHRLGLVLDDSIRTPEEFERLLAGSFSPERARLYAEEHSIDRAKSILVERLVPALHPTEAPRVHSEHRRVARHSSQSERRETTGHRD